MSTATPLSPTELSLKLVLDRVSGKAPVSEELEEEIEVIASDLHKINLSTSKPAAKQTALPIHILPADIIILLSSFTPSTTPRAKSFSYLILSQVSQLSRAKVVTKEEGLVISKQIAGLFSQNIEEKLFYLSDKRNEGEVFQAIEAVCFLSAIFQTDPSAASQILSSEKIRDALLDMTESCIITSSPSSSALALPSSTQLALALAEFLSQASNTKEGRSALSWTNTDEEASSEVQHQQSSTERWLTWLEISTAQDVSVEVRAVAAVALTKLSRKAGDGEDQLDLSGETSQMKKEAKVEDLKEAKKRDEKLAEMMMDLIVQTKIMLDSTALQNAIESLCYLSLQPNIKQLLSNSPTFLTALFNLTRPATDTQSVLPTTLLYGIISTIQNLVAYRPVLSAEQAQIKQLKEMTAPKAQSATGSNKMRPAEQDPLDNNSVVDQRVKLLLASGAVSAVIAVGKGSRDSKMIKDVCGKVMLGLVTQQVNRGMIVQQGGVKFLLFLVQKSNPPSKETLQALAKMCITHSPTMLFGSSPEDAVKPLISLLLSSSGDVDEEPSSLLQQFEALMALTNLSSVGPTISARISSSEGVFKKLDDSLLDDNIMIRRASVELICNLVSCDMAFMRYSGDNGATRTSDEIHQLTNPMVSSKLYIILALTDVEDIQTRLAASGVLATLTSSPVGAHFLRTSNPKKVWPHLIDLCTYTSDSQSGLIHRGLVVVYNLLSNAQDGGKVVDEAIDAGIGGALKDVILGQGVTVGQDIREIAVECLRICAGKVEKL